MRERKLYVRSELAEALPSWPVTWGVPLAPGELRDATAVILAGADKTGLPTQSQALALHPDGSVRRLLVSALVPVHGGAVQKLLLTEHEARPAAKPPAAQEPWPTVGPAALALTVGDRKVHLTIEAADSAGRALEWRVERVCHHSTGPVQCRTIHHGALWRGDQAVLSVRLTTTCHPNHPLVSLAVLLLNDRSDGAVELGHCSLTMEPQPGPLTATEYELRQSLCTGTADLPCEARAESLAVSFTTPDGEMKQSSRLLNFNETWFGARLADGARVVLGLPRFFEQYPYGVRITHRGLSVDFWPAWWGQPWRLPLGVGKTHCLGFAVLEPTAEQWLSRAVGYAIARPPIGHTPLETLQAGGVAEELLDYRPDEHPRIETILYDLSFNRNRGYGKMNWGDDVSLLYTGQLRGAGEVVWNNLEGDYPYHMWCQYARTGRYLYQREWLDSLLHWADVDFCDRCADPLHEGALRVHSAGHVTGHTSPCHNWAEGFKEWYYQTGDPRALEILAKMAEWLVRRAEAGAFATKPEPYVRGCGWGLIQMAALDEVFGRSDIRDLMLDLCRRLLDYCRAHDGLAMTMPTGGWWALRDNAFHTATVVIGAWRCWRRSGEAVARELALTAAEAFFDERTCTPEGIPVYISGPEQDFPMQQAATLTLGALAACWHLTGEERYVRRGMRMLEYCLDRGMIVDHMRIPGQFLCYGDDTVLEPMLLMPNSQLLGYQLRGLLLFMKPAAETGLLREVEYRF